MHVSALCDSRTGQTQNKQHCDENSVSRISGSLLCTACRRAKQLHEKQLLKQVLINRHMPIPLSIVVCTRNCVANLRRCVEALFSVRTSQDWELIIVDNGSDDGTADFLRSLVTSQRKPVVKTAIQVKRGLTAAEEYRLEVCQCRNNRIY